MAAITARIMGKSRSALGTKNMRRYPGRIQEASDSVPVPGKVRGMRRFRGRYKTPASTPKTKAEATETPTATNTTTETPSPTTAETSNPSLGEIKAGNNAQATVEAQAAAKEAAEVKVPNGDQGVAETAEKAAEDATWWQRNKKYVAGTGVGVVAGTLGLSAIASMVMSGGERTNSNLYSPSQATY